MIIEKKIWPEFFALVQSGRKTFEYRLADWEAHEGDTLILKEWDPNTNSYTGRMLARKVSYILKGGEFGVEEGYVVMSIN